MSAVAAPSASAYQGTRLSVSLSRQSGSSNRCFVSACTNTVTPMFTAHLSDGSRRYFHSGCLPPLLLLAAAPYGRYFEHIAGLQQFLAQHHRDVGGSAAWLARMDERLKADCDVLARHADGDDGAQRDLSLFVAQRVASQVECSICVEKVAHRPVSTGCHVFCQHCFVKWVLSTTQPENRESVSCPACRDAVPLSRLRPCDRLLQRIIASMSVRCAQQKQGCTQVVDYGTDGETLRAHLTGCLHHIRATRPVQCGSCDWSGPHSQLAGHSCNPRLPCTNDGCHFTGAASALYQHMLGCAYASFHCAVCHDEYLRNEAAQHQLGRCTYRCRHCHCTIAVSRRSSHDTNARYRLCSYFTPCANGCGQPVLRGVQDRHDDSCADAMVGCRFCNATMKRKNYQRHLDKAHGQDIRGRERDDSDVDEYSDD